MKFDSFVNSHFKQTNLLFDTDKGILYFRNARTKKMEEMPDQERNISKLKRILDNHPVNDDTQHIVYSNEIKALQKRINQTKKKQTKKKQTKKKKIWFFLVKDSFL